MSELTIIPGVIATNGVPRRFTDPERLCSLDRSERGGAYLCDDVPVQLRQFGSADVLGIRHYLEVVWTNARRILAKVVKDESRRDGSDFLFIESSVGAVFLTGDPDSTVTRTVLPATVPDPTGSRVTAVGDSPEVGSHLEAFRRKTSSVTGKKTARFSSDQTRTPERSLHQIGFLAAAALTKHPLSVSKGGGGY